MITLYGIGMSLFVRKVQIVLEMKELPYEREEIPPSQSEDFLRLSPLGKIPVLQDDGFFISDSSVIVQYLESKYLGNSLLPEEPEYLAQALWFEEYSDTKMCEVISGGLYFEKIMKEVMTGQPTDEARVAAAEQAVPAIFNYLEAQLEGKSYLVDEMLSIADVSVISNMVNFLNAGYEIDAEAWPNLSRWTEHVLRIPLISRIMVE